MKLQCINNDDVEDKLTLMQIYEAIQPMASVFSIEFQPNTPSWFSADRFIIIKENLKNEGFLSN